MVSENSIQLKSQASQNEMSIDSAGNSIVAYDVQGKKELEHKPRFLEFTCGHFEVFRYAMLVTKAVIPKAFWGCEKNFEIVQGCMRIYHTHDYDSLTSIRCQGIHCIPEIRDVYITSRTSRFQHVGMRLVDPSWRGCPEAE
ncbi:hypothetical protein DFH29DRAFT_804932 [Suillus ampliporus]|nr:hypothetical protein DFH29DRAFT_804932 [Suillus ampliporus]